MGEIINPIQGNNLEGTKKDNIGEEQILNEEKDREDAHEKVAHDFSNQLLVIVGISNDIPNNLHSHDTLKYFTGICNFAEILTEDIENIHIKKLKQASTKYVELSKSRRKIPLNFDDLGKNLENREIQRKDERQKLSEQFDSIMSEIIEHIAEAKEEPLFHMNKQQKTKSEIAFFKQLISDTSDKLKAIQADYAPRIASGDSNVGQKSN